jgi:hypothetical protein
MSLDITDKCPKPEQTEEFLIRCFEFLGPNQGALLTTLGEHHMFYEQLQLCITLVNVSLAAVA